MDAKSKFSNELELETEFEDLPPSDFLYDRQGPWPQPSPNHPFGEAPGVLHIPFVEWLYWWFMIGSRYVLSWIFMWPVAIIKALLNGKIKKIGDEDFNDYFFNSCYAKFLNPDLSNEIKEIFSSYLKSNEQYYIVDFVGMKVLEPIRNCHCEPSKILFKKTQNKIEVVAINLRDYVVDSTDGDLWMLAKFIAMQGAGNHIVLSMHPRLHFPMDAINAITKTALPKEHILFKLLYPHFEFTLKLDSQVLNSKLSVLVNKWWMFYAPFPANAKSIRELIVLGFHGIKGNSSYPKYEFPLRGPSKVYSDYGDFHDQYYKAFYDFCKAVLGELPFQDKFVTRWADYIHGQMPSFPNGEDIWKGDTLNHAVASYLWDVTLGHGADHKTYAEIPLIHNPLRLRVASPKYKNPNIHIKVSSLVTLIDQSKLNLGNTMFFMPTNVSILLDAFYNFNLPILNKHVEDFHNELQNIEKNLKIKNFMPIKEIPASIQY